jgi:hypothetical protein
MGTKVSIESKEERIAQIDNMLLQRIQEVEASKNDVSEVQSFREKYFANLCKDVFNAEKQ